MAGFFAIAWAWLRARAKGAQQTIIVPSQPASGTPPLVGGFSIAPGVENPFAPAPQQQQAAPFAPSLVSSFFGSTQQPAAPAVDPVEKDYLARTCWGEARGEGKAGQRAVAAVILNRVADRRYPSTVQGVALQRRWVERLQRYIYQFSMWDPLDHNEKLARAVTAADANFRSCLDVAEEALTGRLSDPTGGATMYYSPSAMVPKGSLPGWNFSVLRQSATIGKHVFFVEL